MKEKWILEELAKVGAIITDSHVVYASGKHGRAYVNKDAVYPYTVLTSRLCAEIADVFRKDGVEVVIAPAVGGVILSQWIAHHLTRIIGREVLSVYAEHDEQSVFKSADDTAIYMTGGIIPAQTCLVGKGCELVIKKPAFVIKRGYNKIVAGKNVLVVEDVLNTGESARRVIEVTRALGGNVLGLGALCNRGGLTSGDVANPSRFFSLVNIKLDAYDEADCPLCAKGVPINTDVGKGRAFLARQQMAKYHEQQGGVNWQAGGQ